MRSAAILTSLASIAAFAALAASPAQAATQSFPVGGFDRVQSNIPHDVHVHVGGPPSVTADGPQQLLDRLHVHVAGGRLVIAMRRGTWWSMGHETLTISVTVPELSGVALFGPGNLDVDRVRAPDFEASLAGPGNLRIGQLESGRVTFDLSGPGDISAAGRVRQARFALSGPGNIRAQKLDVQDLDVALSGPGNVDATVSGTASGHLSGPGDIRIGGHPRCQISKSGPGDVRCG